MVFVLSQSQSLGVVYYAAVDTINTVNVMSYLLYKEKTKLLGGWDPYTE